MDAGARNQARQWCSQQHYHNINILERDILLPNISLGMSLMYCSLLVVNTIQEARGEMTGHKDTCMCACVFVSMCYIYMWRGGVTRWRSVYAGGIGRECLKGESEDKGIRLLETVFFPSTILFPADSFILPLSFKHSLGLS